MRIRWWLIALVLVPGCSSGWVVEESQTLETLYAVYGLSASDVFAVGAHGTALHRKDGVWHLLDTGTQEDLFGVWGSDESNVVVVGNNCTVLEFVGDETAPAAGPPPSPFVQLTVGSCGNFRAIDGVRSNLALVVGDGVMQRFNGNRLTDNTPSCNGRMLGVKMVAEDQAVAVGLDDINCVFYTLQNNAWNAKIIKPCSVLLDVWVGAEGTGAAVGTFGGLWTYPPPTDPNWPPLDTHTSGSLFSVTGWVDENASSDKTELFVVGEGGKTLRVRGGIIHDEVVDVNQDLHGVWVSPDGQDIYVVGTAGTIAHRAR